MPNALPASLGGHQAAILLFGMTIYRRAAVGDREAAVEESGEGASLRRTLFFAAGSDPKRARGVSRLGWMRETVRGPEAARRRSAAPVCSPRRPKRAWSNARQSLAAPNSGRNTFGAVMGTNRAGLSRSATAYFEFDASAVWSDRALINQAQSLFDGNVNWRETSWPDLPNQAPPTFLLQLVTLLNKRIRTATGRYVYSEQEYPNARQAAARPWTWTPCRRSRQDSQPPHGSRNQFPTLARGRFIHRPGPLRIPAALDFLRLTFEAAKI